MSEDIPKPQVYIGFSWKRVFTGVVLILGLLSFLGLVSLYLLDRESNHPYSNAYKIASKSASKSSTPTKKDETVDWKVSNNTFTKTGKYSFVYPKGWELETETQFNSPDYEINTEAPGYGLNSGASIHLISEPTKEASIDKMFELEKFGGRLDSTKAITSVGGQKAISYDYAYEAVTATRTIFIHKNVYYVITFFWTNQQAKQKYLNAYKEMLASFKFL